MHVGDGVFMSVSVEDVKRVALLSKLEFDEESLQHMVSDLNDIVKYVEKLDELELDDVKETAHVLDLTNVFRDDKVKVWLTNEEALANAPKSKKGHFSVPKVIGS